MCAYKGVEALALQVLHVALEAREDPRANASLHSSGIAPATEETKAALEKLIVQQSPEERSSCVAQLKARVQKSNLFFIVG